ncbi:Transcription factor MYC/MYB N-terminal [Arabidopsis thaliana x Arabidopsis arenosa]|uniref:Transcription factor MYC/MYB N-terminal n=2 Tax=Arabidopsis thaliana x Arabidopsis arenosa TaxID=1240361 RepID=A0A8T1XHV8_9BRAS|nr:Transcription factor MYC/MYB N-terminal [Arabidopsis thaliana x Arabidopsis arenosa]
MVGSGAGGDRSKDAVGMMALHEALRSVCLNSDWIYSVFWTIRPRPRVRGGNGCKIGDESGSLMLMWEDGFCGGGSCLETDIEGEEDLVRKAFSKMSIQLYNYGEGLMGKVASDKCHKWVFKEPSESEPNLANYWQSSFDALPPEWTDQFESGIQTIAVIQAGHGLLQLGSCKIIPEDLHFVLRMRQMFESIGYRSGFYLSQLFSSNRTATTPSSSSVPNQIPQSQAFNWGSHSPLLPSPSFQNQLPASARFGFLQDGNVPPQMLPPMEEHEDDIKWPNGLSLFNALTGRADEASRLLFNQEQNPMNVENQNEFLSLEGHHHQHQPNKFRRSYTLPARMDSSSSSTSLDQQPPLEFRNNNSGSNSGLFPDVMETFLR